MREERPRTWFRRGDEKLGHEIVLGIVGDGGNGDDGSLRGLRVGGFGGGEDDGSAFERMDWHFRQWEKEARTKAPLEMSVNRGWRRGRRKSSCEAAPWLERYRRNRGFDFFETEVLADGHYVPLLYGDSHLYRVDLVRVES